jgi:predicted RNA-binding protein with PIN domain
MARLYLLIDGYNLLFAAGCNNSRPAPGHIQQARTKLLLALHQKLDPEIAANTVVVFDRSRSSDDFTRDSPPYAKFHVCCSPPGTDADSEIESRLAQHSSPRQILVVSSDHRLHRAAARRGACSMDSELFLDLLESHSTQALKAAAIKRTSKKTNSPQQHPEKPDVPANLLEQLADLHEEFLRIDPNSLLPPAKGPKR